MDITPFLLAMGVPSAITGLLVWWLKRHIDKRDEKSSEKEANIEKLVFMIMQTTRANYVLTEATARAVQRIPDAHCNGDMEKALEEAHSTLKKEDEFITDQGIRSLFGD